MRILFDSLGRGRVALTHVGSVQGASLGGLIGIFVMPVNPRNLGKEEHTVDSSCRIVRHGDSEIKRMSNDDDQTKQPSAEFDFSAFPPNTLFHERRTGRERRTNLTKNAAPEHRSSPAPGERKAKKERRRRIDPTTFDKQYSDDEMEFMNAVQRFKEQSGSAFPSYGDVLKVAVKLGYRQVIDEPPPTASDHDDTEPVREPS
jgi:hypothetical protein